MIKLPDDTRVLVTGAAGFIGSHLCDRLRADGHLVYAASRSFRPHSDGKFHQLSVDLNDAQATRALIDQTRPAVIFHLAGLAAGARDPALVLPTFASNLTSTVNVLSAALEFGKPRVVLPASLEEPSPGEIASSPYAMSKWAATEYSRMFHLLYQLPVSIARIFITYGPTRKDLHKIFPYVLLSLLAGESPKLSSGLREVDWIHVDDVVDGLIALAVAPGAVGVTCDIGSGTLVSIRAVVEQMASRVASSGKPLFGALPDRPFEQVRVADIAHSFTQTGWRPSVDLDRGLATTVEWFRRNQTELRPG